MGDGDTDSDGVKYMNTWKHVCRRVRLIQHLYHIYKNIVPFKLNRPEIQTVWIEGRDNQEYGHSGKEKGSHLIKPGYIIEKEPQKGDYNKRKPQKVRDDKIFDKRNIVIQCRMDHMEVRIRCYVPLKIVKPGHINQNI